MIQLTSAVIKLEMHAPIMEMVSAVVVSVVLLVSFIVFLLARPVQLPGTFILLFCPAEFLRPFVFGYKNSAYP